LDTNVATAAEGLLQEKNGVNGRHKHSNLVGVMDENLDLQILRGLQGKTTVIPVISKADTLTTAHMGHLKRMVWDSLKKSQLDPLEALGLDDFDGNSDSNRSSALDEKDEEDEEGSIIIQKHEASEKATSDLDDTDDGSREQPRPKRSASRLLKRASNTSSQGHSADSSADTIPYLPLSIISPDIYDPGTIGRKFPWGFADPYNIEHCDFVRLKEAVFSEWRGELREASRELWYEGWRTSRLRKTGRGR
jgi:septin family protein